MSLSSTTTSERCREKILTAASATRLRTCPTAASDSGIRQTASALPAPLEAMTTQPEVLAEIQPGGQRARTRRPVVD